MVSDLLHLWLITFMGDTSGRNDKYIVHRIRTSCPFKVLSLQHGISEQGLFGLGALQRV